MRKFGNLAVAGTLVVVLLQLIRPDIQSGPATAEIQVPLQIRQILAKDCYSCHSNERRLAWFDEIVPAYWLARHDVLTAREHLNFSTLGSKPVAAQKATLFEAVNMIQLGAMPLPQFTALHHDARVTPDELAVLKAYLAPWNSDNSAGKDSVSLPLEAPPKADLAAVPAEFNGLAFQQEFESWKPISFTDRGDNHTLRVILGNYIAVQAAKSGNVSPWPDGAQFAKIAWQRAAGEDGLVHPGDFVQVEIMVKDARLYKHFEGWGWGRWRGTGLKPYGTDSHFVSECTGCHLPLRGDDFVYTLPISLAKASRDEVLNNQAASLPQTLPYQPLDWDVITIYVDPKSRSMAALYGNDAAMRAVRTRSTGSKAASAGSVLGLVTWFQREDPHWFGGRIPDVPKSVEFVQTDARSQTAYLCYDGPTLGEHRLPADVAQKRIKFISNLAPVWLP